MKNPPKEKEADQVQHGGVLTPVFYPAVFLILAMVLVSIFAGSSAEALFSDLQSFIARTAGWFYTLAVTGFLILCLYLAFGRLGNIRLGPDHSTPDYSFVSWFAMLFSAGIGIGLLFFGVAEPITHFINPPDAEPRSYEAAKQAMQITYFHWGISAWSIYAIVGLFLAYFGFRHGLPLSVRSALYPLIGERIHGPIGHTVDVLAIVSTMFGVATSLGLGVAQINTGLSVLFDLSIGPEVQLGLIAVITLMATISVVSGLDAGIKKLSEINMVFAILILAFVILLGPTLLILNSFGENFGLYAEALVTRSFLLGAYGADKEWLGNWTLFYWGWWISWSPFVGIFIARISRGRTIKEFILGVLVVPSLFIFVWMTAFGNGALAVEMANSSAGIASAVQENLSMGLFVYLQQLPLANIVSLLATLLIVTFFVTSSDSGSLVIDTIASGGHLDPPVWQRVFWAIMEGVVAATLLVTGGLVALQAATITAALPFAVVIMFASAGLLKGLRMEAAKIRGAQVAPEVPVIGAGVSWKHRLKSLLDYPSPERVDDYVASVVKPALMEVAKAIESIDCAADIEISMDPPEIRICHGAEMDFNYSVVAQTYLKPDFAYMGSGRDSDSAGHYARAEVYLLEGGQGYDVFGFSKDQIIQDVLGQYDKHMHFLHIAR